MNRDDQRIAFAGLVSDRLHEHAARHLAVGRRPRDFLFVAEREVAHLWVGVGELSPAFAVADLIERRGEERRWRFRIGVVDDDDPTVLVAIHIEGRPLIRHLAHRARRDVERQQLIGCAHAGGEVDGLPVG